MNRFHPFLFSLALASFASAQDADTALERRVLSLGDPPFETVQYDAPGDGRLWARGQTYKASFGAEGATYIPFLGSEAPRNMPVRMRLAEASVGGLPIRLEPEAAWSRNADTVILDRGDVDVHYLLETDSVEQTFVFHGLPRSGDLEVRVAIDSELEAAVEGQGFRFAGERGGVRYGAATVYDGAGRHLQLESSLQGSEIAIRVPDEFLREATLPIVVDPVITTYVISNSATVTTAGDACYDASSGYYLHAYGYQFSDTDHDVYIRAVDGNGVYVPGQSAFIDMTDNIWDFSMIANNNSANNCMVVARAKINGEFQIWGRIRNIPGTTMGPQVQISPNSNYPCGYPSIGGEAMDDGSDLYCVAWVKYLTYNDRQVRYRMMNTAGQQVGASLTLDDFPDTKKHIPHVSRSCGTGVASERCWNIVWTSSNDDPGHDVWGAQIGSQGEIKTPRFIVDSTGDADYKAQVSAPLDSPTGGKRDYLVVYGDRSTAKLSVRARLFKEDTYQATFNITEMEADLVGSEILDLIHLGPSVGTDGSQFIVNYSERQEDSSEHMYICSLRHQGNTLVPTEPHVLLAASTGDLWSSHITTQHDGGALGSRELAVSFAEYLGPGLSNTMGALYSTPENWGILGQTFCSGEANSTGYPANFRVYGSADPADNRLVLDVDNLPAWSWGQFMMSTTTQSMPLGNGTLCLGQPLMRLNNTVGNSWIKGSLGFELDLTNLPGNTVLQGGQTWYFQLWYRDAGSTNLSNAEAVTFQ